MKQKIIKKEYLFFLFILIALFTLSKDVYSTSSCSSSYLLLSYSGLTNAQASTGNAANIAVCSQKAQPGSQSDAGAVKLIALSSSLNAHAEKTATGYTNIAPYTSHYIWIKPATGVNSISVYYDTSCNHNTGDECAFSISSDTNAHIASCTGGYSTKVCIGSLSCGTEGTACPLSDLNGPDNCCSAFEAPPNGFKCRYYEGSDPPVNPPYTTKCCENGLETSRMCGTVGGTTLTPCITNMGDRACCDDFDSDCVYNGFCYTDDNDPNSAELWTNMSCSTKHWCPKYFEWDDDPLIQTCVYAGPTPCYSGPSTTYCTIPTSPYFNIGDPADCLGGGIGSIYNPGPNPYEDACCYWTSFMINYYSWQDIIVYSSSGGGGWVNLQELEHEFEG